MAKIALVFLFAFCVFQISAAARIPREASDDIQKVLDNTLLEMKQFLEKTFSKENVEKMGSSLKEFGEQISEKGKELVQQADAGIKKLQAKDQPAA